ncbi:hypothetical protein SteCoe_14547 [Stentor coeruleus]|uniref:Uncharacterized protein n=1 Tax=Stentor coeruleus TaxID=5963 RepID=A0A1R2C5Y4_9CILI|nr:hypothetical protein SteCoe_14547 [Stentor coeruleus]
MSEPNMVIQDSLLDELRGLEEKYNNSPSPEFKLKGGLDAEKVKEATQKIEKCPDVCNESEMLTFIIDMHQKIK